MHTKVQQTNIIKCKKVNPLPNPLQFWTAVWHFGIWGAHRNSLESPTVI